MEVAGDEGEDFAAARCMNYAWVSKCREHAKTQQLAFMPISPLDMVLGVFPDIL